MSENDIREELRETRILVRESHAELLTEVKEISKDTKKDVRDSNAETREFIKWAIGVCAVFIIGLCIDHIALKQEVAEITADFGTILLIAPPDHSEAIQFDVLRNKYNPTRGKKSASNDLKTSEQQ